MKVGASAVITFNCDLLGIDPRPIAPMSAAEEEHLAKCLLEEVSEMQDSEDLIVKIDSLLDSIYFALGGLYKMGLSAEQIEECFLAVHDCNMQKVRGKIASRAVEGAVDAAKPDGWVSPEKRIGEILFRED